MKGSSPQHLLLECAINYAKTDDDIDVVRGWFEKDIFVDLEGKEHSNVDISNKHRHLMVRRVWSSFRIPKEDKEAILTRMGEIDSSDWLEKTKYFCVAAEPTRENKEA